MPASGTSPTPGGARKIPADGHPTRARGCTGVVLAPQNPLRLDDYSEPEPDIALLRPRDDFYTDTHPTPADALLVVEVADTTLIKDRRVKLPLYARAGVSEVWVVSLDARELEIYREPSGDAYSEVERVSEGAVRSLAFPDEEIDVGKILGPR